jgi:hypothetical protein
MRRSAGTWSVRLLALLGGAGAILLAGLPGSAYAAGTDGPDYEMPFACGQVWTGSSRPSHSPSALSIDWNRTNDLGQPMMAAAPGVVTRVADLGTRSYGRYIIVDHGGGRTSLYAHLLNIWTRTGQAVDQGTLLGHVGSTGGSTGPHLHFEERLNGTDQRSYFHRRLFTMGTTLASQSCGDTPVIGNWDGHAGFNIGVLRRSATPQFLLKRPGRSTLTISYGQAGDQPVAGDWNGDRTTDVGVRRPSLKSFLLRNADGTTTRIKVGTVFGTAVTGDWNGDGRTDLGVWTPRTRTFTLRTQTRAGAVSTTRVAWGSTTGLPVAGDWNGDGIGDVGTWSPASATFSLRVSPTRTRAAGTRTATWGLRRG